MYIVFDTETNGLPKDYNSSPKNVDNYPRVMQLVFFAAMWMLFLGISQKMLNSVKTNCKNCDRGFDDCIC